MQTLALFDFDGTLIRGDTIVAYVRRAREKRLIGYGEMLRIVCCTLLSFDGMVSTERAKQTAIAFRMRMSEDARDAFDRDFAREYLLPNIFRQGAEALREHAARGDTVLIVSASTENYMLYLKELLPITAVLCTRVSKDGRVSGNCLGAEKVKRVQAWLEERDVQPDWAASTAYGDSESDLPMLALCGRRVFVNAKKRLQKRALGESGRFVTW